MLRKLESPLPHIERTDLVTLGAEFGLHQVQEIDVVIDQYDSAHGTAASHQFHSAAIAYSAMQSYHDIIKFGTNVIPDNKKLYDGNLTIFPDVGDDNTSII